jgi:hypothetical protein
VSEWDIAPGRETEEARQQPNAAERAEVLRSMQRRMADRDEFRVGGGLAPGAASGGEPSAQAPDFSMMAEGAGGMGYSEIPPGGALDGSTLANQQAAGQGQAGMGQAGQGQAVVANGLLPAANLPQQKPGLGLQGHRSLNIATEPMGDELEFVGLGDKPQLQVALIDKSWTDQWTWAVGCFALAIGLLCSWCSIRMGLVWAALLLLLSGGAQWLHDSLPEAATVLERLFWVVVALTLWRSLVAIGRGYRRLLTGMRRQSTPAWQSTVAGVVSVGIGLVGLSWIDHSNSACWGQGQETNAVKPLSLPDQAIVITYDPAAVQRRLDGRWLVPKAWFDRVRLAAETEASNRPVYPQELLLPGGTFDLTLPGPATLSVVGTFAVNLPGEEPTYVPLPVGSGSLLSATLDDVPVPVVDRVLKPGDGVVAAEPIKWLRLPGQGLHTLKLQWRYPVTRVPGGWEVEGQLPVSTAADIAIRELPIGSRLTWSAAQIDRSQTIDSSGAVTDLGVGPDGRFKVRWRTAEDQVRIHSAAIDHDSIVTVRESGVQVVSQFRVTTIESTRELMIRIPRGVQIERLSGDNLRGWSWVEGRADQIELQFLSSQTTHNFLLLLVGETTFWSPVPAEFDVPFPQVQGDGPVNGQVMVLRSQSLQVSTTKVQGLKRRDASADARPATWLAWYRELFPSRPYQAYQWQASAGQLQLSVARPNGQLKVGHRSVVHFDVAKTMFETQIVLEPVNGPVNRVRLQLPKSMEPLSLSCVTGSGANVAAVAYQVAKRPGGEAWDEYELRFAAYHAQPLRLTILGTLASALQQPLVWQPIQVADATQQDYEYALTRNDTVELNLTDVAGADRVLPDEFKGWLEPERVARLPLALRARTAQHSLTVSCQRSTPLVTFESITDLTVGDRLVEETVLLEWTIERSGVNQVEFLLPSRWRDCQLEGPWIGRIQREGAAEDQIRFTIHLQDRIVGQYRLVATLDLPIEATPSQASIPQNLTGETRQRWITAQNSGQTEVEFLPQRDVAQVVRQRAIFADLQRKIKAAFLTNAFSVEAQARQPVLAWRPVPRSVVETRSARIRLTETDLMLDRQGWYVARQKLQISNRTQPKLQLQMPPDARLVGLLVDGQPVQPLANPWGVASTVLIPLLKSSELNLDYPIELVYEGQIPLARGWQETAMPLATTVDIESEVSHVRLHLPPEMRPWYFGGTMSQVNSAGELLAEVQDYQTRLLADFKSSISASKLSLKQQMRRKLEFDDYLSRNSMFDEAAQSSQLRSEIEELSKVLSGDELTDQPTLGNRANIRGLVADQENRNEVKQDATYFNNFDNPVADQQQEIMLGQIQQRQSQQTDKSNAGDLRLNANQLLSQNYAADEDLQVLSGKSRRSDVAALLPPQGQAEKPGRFAEATPQLPDFGLADAAPQQIAGPTVPRIPSGLSLDFAPAGTVYYFRVPRGKPELTVTWSTHEAATRLGSTVQLVGFAALLLFMARLFRGSGQRRSQSVG